MSTMVYLLFTGLSLGALYFLLASGLCLIFGLIQVMNFAHGAILAMSAYVSWLVIRGAGLADGTSTWKFVLAAGCAVLAGAAIGFAMEVLLIRPLYGRDHLDSLLVTLGLGLAVVAVIRGIWGPEEHSVPSPRWMRDSTEIFGASITNDRLVLISSALLLLFGIQMFLRRTRHGLIVRAGVENREMVTSLGIDVRRSFTLVFTIGGAAAGLAGVLAGTFTRALQPTIGDRVLLYAFIVLIVGGVGSISGAAIAAVLVGLVQQFSDFYIRGGSGELIVIGLMAVILLVRPQGIAGVKERLV